MECPPTLQQPAPPGCEAAAAAHLAAAADAVCAAIEWQRAIMAAAAAATAAWLPTKGGVVKPTSPLSVGNGGGTKPSGVAEWHWVSSDGLLVMLTFIGSDILTEGD
mmetsp:Transcript_76963/g.213901  ORF Transcript_76963/g.213901 Transcript_76963/m.213901 type:complete len:106 (+) Transcript_76963:322-639(+)